MKQLKSGKAKSLVVNLFLNAQQMGRLKRAFQEASSEGRALTMVCDNIEGGEMLVIEQIKTDKITLVSPDFIQ